MARESHRPGVVIAGGGVAALEACLALRERLSADDLGITLVAPTDRFEYRPLAVLEPFSGISRWSLDLSSFADDQDVDVVHDAVAAVAPRARAAVTGSGTELGYDALLLAVGGHTADAVHGALTFRGPRDQGIRDQRARYARADDDDFVTLGRRPARPRVAQAVPHQPERLAGPDRMRCMTSEGPHGPDSRDGTRPPPVR